MDVYWKYVLIFFGLKILNLIDYFLANPRVSHYVYKAGLREECQNYEASCQRREIRYEQIQGTGINPEIRY